MAWQFDGTDGDRVTGPTTTNTRYTSQGITLDMCWIKFDALVSGQFFMSHGQVNGISIAPTTSEIRVTTDQATTDAVYETAGAGLTTGVWYFIAVLVTRNSTGPVNRTRVWVGTMDVSPRDLGALTTITGPSGSATNSGGHTAGNRGTLSVSVNGRIEMMSTFQSPIVSTLGGTWHVKTDTSDYTADQLERVLTTIVQPVWQGGFPLYFAMCNSSTYTGTGDGLLMSFESDKLLATLAASNAQATTVLYDVCTSSGAAWENERGPVPYRLPQALHSDMCVAAR